MDTTQAVLITLLYLVIDTTYIYLIKDRAYAMVTSIQHKPMKLNTTSAILAYIFLVFSILYIGIPFMMSRHHNSSSKLVRSLTTMGALGLCIYAVFAFTNMAIFANYWPSMVVADCVWGLTVYTLVGYVYLALITK